jgi:hypothetical protein
MTWVLRFFGNNLTTAVALSGSIVSRILIISWLDNLFIISDFNLGVSRKKTSLLIELGKLEKTDIRSFG